MAVPPVLSDLAWSPRTLPTGADGTGGTASQSSTSFRTTSVASALPAFPDLKNAIFSAVSRPVTPNYAAVSAAISNNVNSALRGQLTVAQALNKANYDMQRALDAVHPPGR
jgi:ABC-type glycerol-3-phosphate transport system substrate-binding protein